MKEIGFKNMSELVSTVITTYKRPPAMFIRALNSVLNQTYKNLEVIVVDDSPSDYPHRKEIEDAVNEKARLGFNIRYIPHKENLGACAARNTGIMNASGTYIAFLDDDDEWLPSKIKKQVDVIQKTDSALVYCGLYYQNDNTNKKAYVKTIVRRGNIFKELLYSNFIDSTSIPLIRLECLKKIGGFDILMESAQDFDVWLRIAINNRIDCVDEPLVIYHEHSSEQITNNPVKKINGLQRINKKYRKYIAQNSSLWWRRHIIITPYYAMNGEKDKAIKEWYKCVKKNPLNIIGNMRYLRIILFTTAKEVHG